MSFRVEDIWILNIKIKKLANHLDNNQCDQQPEICLNQFEALLCHQYEWLQQIPHLLDQVSLLCRYCQNKVLSFGGKI
jgi:hypothetical protein